MSPTGTPARSTAASIAIAARSSGRTPESAPPYRPTGVRTAERITARLTPPAYSDELDAHGVREGAQRFGAPQQLLHGLTPLVAVVLRQLVHVHPDEPVGEVRLEPAAELHRIRHRLTAVLEPGPDRLGENRRELGERPLAQVAPRDVCAQRQRQPGLEHPPLAEVEHLREPLGLVGELALVD